MFSVLYNLGNLTGTITSTFMATQTLKRNVQEELRLTHDPQQRHELEYILQRFESLNPMSAGGYFTVNKGSLTSMLSVRFKKYFAKIVILQYHPYFSLTYIIILVQFQVSSPTGEEKNIDVPTNCSLEGNY